MTKDELLKEVTDGNYMHVQSLIKEAMTKGKTSETFCMADCNPAEGWEITQGTVDRLKQDGFSVEPYLNKFGIYEGTVEVSW